MHLHISEAVVCDSHAAGKKHQENQDENSAFVVFQSAVFILTILMNRSQHLYTHADQDDGPEAQDQTVVELFIKS